MSRLKEKYKEEIIPTIMERHGYNNVMQVPCLDKLVLNIGLGEATQNPKALEAVERDLTAIMVSHRPDEVEKVGELVLRIVDGIVRAETHS